MSTPESNSNPFKSPTNEEANSIAAARNPLEPYEGFEKSANAEFINDAENESNTCKDSKILIVIFNIRQFIFGGVSGQRPDDSEAGPITSPFVPRDDRALESEEVNSSMFSSLLNVFSNLFDNSLFRNLATFTLSTTISATVALNYKTITHYFHGSSVPVVSAPANSPATVSVSQGVDMNRVFMPEFNAYGEPLSNSYKTKVLEGVKTCGDKFLEENPYKRYQIKVSDENFIATITVPTFGANGEVVDNKRYPLYTTGFKCTTK